MTLGGGTLTGTLTATKLQVNAGALITFANTAAPLPDRLQITPSGGLDLDLRVSAICSAQVSARRQLAAHSRSG